MEQNKPTNEAAVTARLQQNAAATETEIDLGEVFFTLLHNWKLLMLACVMGIVVMAGYYGLFVRNTYEATTELYITNTDSVISFQDLQIGSALTEDYRTIITSRSVLNKVISDLQLNINCDQLRKLITVSNPSGTHIITTSVRTSDIETSRNIANDLLNVSIDQIYQIVGTGKPTVIDYSEAEAVRDVTPSLMRFMVIGGVLGMLVVIAFIVIKMLMDTTIKNDDDVEKYLQMPVLSAVPFYED